jgi:hypothetical protein
VGWTKDSGVIDDFVTEFENILGRLVKKIRHRKSPETVSLMELLEKSLFRSELTLLLCCRSVVHYN